MEDFSGVYDAVRDGNVPVSYTGFAATDLEIEQLQDASVPFLRITPDTAVQHIVVPQDIAQIRKFCDKTGGNSKNPAVDEYCVRCKAHDTTTNSLSLSEKQIHLDLALRLLRHLNSPLFQRRFKLLQQRDTTLEGKQDEKCAPFSTESNSAPVRGGLTGPDVRFLHIEENGSLLASAHQERKRTTGSGASWI